MTRLLVVLAALLLAWASPHTPAGAGHESPFYPSFYPQEITIQVLDPASAAALLRKRSLHAYVGPNPFGQGLVPAHVTMTEFLGSYLVVTANPAAEPSKTREVRCATARRILSALSAEKGAFTFHPYPVTPYHADYLHHFDRAKSAKAEVLATGEGPGGGPFRVRAVGQLAETLSRSHSRPRGQEWDATVEEVDVAALVASRAFSLNGWLGPPWIKYGWFHAYLLLADRIADSARRHSVDSLYRRLTSGSYDGMVEKLEVERRLVALLSEGCERVVAGYTLRRAYLNDDFSEGVENIATDSQAGLVSPVFVRTVKLKDFPWNGWLRLGIDTRPSSAWNPVSGFTDPVGRLIWYTVGDPAFLPAPSTATWLPSRVIPVATDLAPPAGGIEVPPDALVPEPGSGALRPAGAARTAGSKLTYRVRMSAFHDGTGMTVADVLYPFVFAYRWGVRQSQGAPTYDPLVEESTALLREQLVALRVLRVEEEEKTVAEVQLVRRVPVVEVYLRAPGPDLEHVLPVAPPWSSLPWHLLVLMEEAVTRGIAAFSPAEVVRRGVGWLDLVRDQSVRTRLSSLAEEFERRGHLPETLKEFTTVDEARQRWAALRQFHETHGHFLVTNGPYRLEKWSADSAVFQVFRDFSYPLGVGSFDRHAVPPTAAVTKVVHRADGLKIWADIEKAERVQRAYTTVREPLTKASTAGGFEVRAVCSYVVLDRRGSVVTAGVAAMADDGAFPVDLNGLKPGQYTVMTAVLPNGNTVNPDVTVVDHGVER
ncbi:MAG: hypothetical protein HY726_15810 [Candidatus Rokubacteria bacterium]|nr:hypothetical protein [Candidatus Rokubacteria bacterium]